MEPHYTTEADREEKEQDLLNRESTSKNEFDIIYGSIYAACGFRHRPSTWEKILSSGPAITTGADRK